MVAAKIEPRTKIGAAPKTVVKKATGENDIPVIAAGAPATQKNPKKLANSANPGIKFHVISNGHEITQRGKKKIFNGIFMIGKK